MRRKLTIIIDILMFALLLAQMIYVFTGERKKTSSVDVVFSYHYNPAYRVCRHIDD